MARADHLMVKRFGGIYSHHGIDLGKGKVIHYSGEPGQKSNACIRIDSKSDFACGDKIEIVKYGSCNSPDKVIKLALSKLGEKSYDLIFNNCEHFARWCKTGSQKSEQVKDAVSVTGGASITGIAATGSIGVVSAAGAVSGLSGAGVMSGLATVGGVVGSGAVGGIATLAAGPAILASVAMTKVLEDDDSLPENERDARLAGRISTYGTAAIGTAGSVAAVSALGTTAGLSAAGITSGLAAIGGVVGGGMAAGVAVTVAAPAVAATALGYGIYKVVKWFSS